LQLAGVLLPFHRAGNRCVAELFRGGDGDAPRGPLQAWFDRLMPQMFPDIF
jgi:hypothetical protein